MNMNEFHIELCTQLWPSKSVEEVEYDLWSWSPGANNSLILFLQLFENRNIVSNQYSFLQADCLPVIHQQCRGLEENPKHSKPWKIIHWPSSTVDPWSTNWHMGERSPPTTPFICHKTWRDKMFTSHSCSMNSCWLITVDQMCFCSLL